MTLKRELEKVKRERKYDTEWLAKYKRIVDGLQTLAEIQLEGCNDDINEWSTITTGLASLSELIQEDIDGRKEDEQ